jgi:hypothetical protein
MAASLNINNILSQVKQLDKEDQLTLLQRMASLLKRKESNDTMPIPFLVWEAKFGKVRMILTNTSMKKDNGNSGFQFKNDFSGHSAVNLFY